MSGGQEMYSTCSGFDFPPIAFGQRLRFASSLWPIIGPVGCIPFPPGQITPKYDREIAIIGEW